MINYKNGLSHLFIQLRKYLTSGYAMLNDQVDPFPSGHFYSPTINVSDIRNNESRIWPDNPTIKGIDFNEEYQRHLLTTIFTQYQGDFNYPFSDSPQEIACNFDLNNTQFSLWDSQILYTFLRAFKPKNMVEVGSGFSSLLTADVNRNYLKSALNFVCIEPHPRQFLIDGVPGITDLVVGKVEEVDMSIFDILDSGDILFIDSSHVSKTGSDVNYIYFDILPRLKSGVMIHIHDIFFPQDYKKNWVLKEHRSWNEQYILQALLMYSSGFEVLFGANYSAIKFPELLKVVQKKSYMGGGSFWIRKV